MPHGQTTDAPTRALHITTSFQVLNWVKARADAEDVSISELVTRILTAAMDRDRERYSTREEGSSAESVGRSGGDGSWMVSIGGIVGPRRVRVCSPRSRRFATLRPRFAGHGLDRGSAHAPGRLLSDDP